MVFCRLLASAFLSLAGISAFSQEKAAEKYIDAQELTLIGQPRHIGGYHRVDTVRYSDLSPRIKELYSYSTGMAIVFKTNSRRITAQWKTAPVGQGANMNSIAQKGLDLYIRRQGVWVWAGFGKPSGNDHLDILAENMDDSDKECLLYLPLFSELLELKIGVDHQAYVKAADNPFSQQIIVWGSSITNGIAAGRSGMSYPSLMARSSGLHFVNLGISGQSKLQPELARMLADMEADAFVFDAFSNPNPAEIESRFQNFVAIIREKHPHTPLIFLQTIVREGGNFDLKREAFEKDKREAAAKMVGKVRAMGDLNVFFVNPESILGNDHTGTIDGTHPSDLGFFRMAEKWLPEILRIFSNKSIL
ncbi:MAG: hypothetical protein GX115_09970 [Ruminiclostridium sp.]|nr:hypothetical protein [Ruminiclostridium sp.]